MHCEEEIWIQQEYSMRVGKAEGEKREEMENQIYVPPVWQHPGVCKSRKSIPIDPEELGYGREIGLYTAPAPRGSLDHGYSPLC